MVEQRKQPLSIDAAECVGIMERLIAIAFTGSPKRISYGPFKHVGLLQSLKLDGFPYVNNKIIDLANGIIHSKERWPKHLGSPASSWNTAVFYHFGKTVGALSKQRTALAFSLASLSGLYRPSLSEKEVVKLFVNVIEECLKPALHEIVWRQLDSQIKPLERRARILSGQEMDLSAEEIQEVEVAATKREALEAWTQSDEINHFTLR